MRSAAKVAKWTVRISGILQLLMGVVIWTGVADPVIPVHIAIGVVLVFGLWVLAALAIGRAPAWQVGLAFIWGLFMPALGMTQQQLLPDGLHWTIQVVHLLVGIAAIGQAESLAMAIRSTGGRNAPQPVQ